MSNLLSCLEDRYAKIIEQQLNEDGSELFLFLNLGAIHPATRFSEYSFDGLERIVKPEPTIGYIHVLSKNCGENRPFTNYSFGTDRMNYCSSPINNMGWWMTLEKLWILKFQNVLNIYELL
jgi:NADH-quinone oxidoreductase subunit D